MTPQEIEALFTRSDGTYLCARWERPIVPIIFGVEDATLAVVKGACEAVVALAGHQMAETDPEMGANLMVFFFRDWKELLDVPDLGRMVPDLEPLVRKLQDAGADQYRAFRFEESGAIRACFVFLRMSGDLADMPAETLSLTQMVHAILLWSENAFREKSPLALTPEGHAVLRPEIGNLIQAVYGPAMPAVAQDATHALRLSARVGLFGASQLE